MALGRPHTDAVLIDMGIVTEPKRTVDADGYQEWRVNGLLHRVDGPARIKADGTQVWYVNDQCITDEVEAWMKTQCVTWPWNDETQMQFVLTWG